MGAAFLTPVYMGRLFFNVFLGKPHSQKAENARESSAWMTVPIVNLAVYSFAGAWSFAYDIIWFDGKMDGLIPSAATTFVGDTLKSSMAKLEAMPHMHTLETVALIMTVIGILLSYAIFVGSRGYDIVER